jgi:hypothetical protein
MRTKSLHLLGRLAALGVVAVTATWTQNAAAQNAECSSLPHPLLVVGSSAVKPFMAQLGQALAAADTPISLIYDSPGSCTGQNDFFGDGTYTKTGLTIYNAAGDQNLKCDITTPPMAINIAISDVFYDTCSGNPASMPAGTKDFHGPVQSMVFAKPSTSAQTLITAEAAYLTFGLGAAGDTNWNDPSHIFARSASSGTQQMIATAIQVPAGNFIQQDASAGNDFSAAHIQTELIAANADPSVANISLGILGMDVVRKPSVDPMNVGQFVPLAYQHFGQTAAYYPSSDFASNDMQNTRDGHYMIQGPVHMFTSVNGSGVPTNADAKTFIDYMTGAVIPTSFDLVATEAGLSIVPQCAMRVTRDSEVGPFMSFMPPVSCECKWLHEVSADLPSECATCDSTHPCDSSRPACNYGYCEVQ